MNRYILPFLWAIAFLLSLFGSPIDCYYASLSAGAAAAIAAGGVIGGFISDYMNTKSQADTNEANKQIARENRVWQSNENQLQRDWSERQWNMNNAYNTPSAIAQRQREAGFNPYLLGSELGQGSSQPVNASVSTSAPNSPQMVAPRVGATSSALQNAGNTLIEYSLQRDAVNAQAANQTAQADAQTVDTAMKLKRIYGEKKIPGTNLSVDENYVNNRFKFTHGFSSESSLDYREGKAKVEEAEASAQLATIRADIEKEFGREKAVRGIAAIDQSITESAAKIGKMASDAKLNEAKIKTESAKFWTEVAQAFKLKKEGEYYVASSSQINLLKGLVASRMTLENGSLAMQYESQKSSFSQQSIFRDWQESDKGKANFMTNQNIARNEWLNGADKVIHSISPLIPSSSIGLGLQTKVYKGLGYD